MDVKSVQCELCGEVVSSLVVYLCINPACDVPQHVACVDDFLRAMSVAAEIQEGMATLP